MARSLGVSERGMMILTSKGSIVGFVTFTIVSLAFIWPYFSSLLELVLGSMTKNMYHSHF